MWLWVWPVLGLALATTSTSAGGEPEPSSVDKVSCGGRDTEVHSPLFVKTVHDEAHFRCEGGFQLRGQRIATCVANNWDHPFPTCQELNKTTITSRRTRTRLKSSGRRSHGSSRCPPRAGQNSAHSRRLTIAADNKVNNNNSNNSSSSNNNNDTTTNNNNNNNNNTNNNNTNNNNNNNTISNNNNNNTISNNSNNDDNDELPEIRHRGPRPVTLKRPLQYPEQFERYFMPSRRTEFEPVASALRSRRTEGTATTTALLIDDDDNDDDDDIAGNEELVRGRIGGEKAQPASYHNNKGQNRHKNIRDGNNDRSHTRAIIGDEKSRPSHTDNTEDNDQYEDEEAGGYWLLTKTHSYK